MTPIAWTDVLGRLALSIAAGAVIGFDRELRNKSAGLRTNMLVSLGSGFFILLSIQSGLIDQDPSIFGRVLQGIITGVGFVGAGTIFRGDRVRGLTSAAAIWMSSALGVAAGVGLWEMVIIGSILALIVLTLLKQLE